MQRGRPVAVEPESAKRRKIAPVVIASVASPSLTTAGGSRKRLCNEPAVQSFQSGLDKLFPGQRPADEIRDSFCIVGVADASDSLPDALTLATGDPSEAGHLAEVTVEFQQGRVHMDAMEVADPTAQAMGAQVKLSGLPPVRAVGINAEDAWDKAL